MSVVSEKLASQTAIWILLVVDLYFSSSPRYLSLLTCDAFLLKFFNLVFVLLVFNCQLGNLLLVQVFLVDSSQHLQIRLRHLAARILKEVQHIRVKSYLVVRNLNRLGLRPQPYRLEVHNYLHQTTFRVDDLLSEKVANTVILVVLLHLDKRVLL